MESSYLKQEYPQKCVHTLFEEQAEKAPQSVALVYEDQCISRGELNLRANQLAQALRELGVRQETLVGICLKSSPEAIMAVLAVLKAGGAFVPLDPSYPGERLDYMIRDTQVSLILTNTALKNRVPGDPDKICCIDSASLRSTGVGPAVAWTGATIDNTACVLYTSGSTGQPKGIVRSHRSIVSRLAWASAEPDEVLCQSLSLSVGFSQESTFVALMCGLLLVIVPEDKLPDMNHFVATLEATGVTTLNLVPASFRQLLSLGPEIGSRLRALRTVVLAGAAFPSELIQAFVNALPQAHLINCYGATEVGSAIRGQMTGKMASAPGSLGRPVANAQIRILDTDMRPVPHGRTGELYISAPSLALGYLNQPELTAQRFVPDPFGDAAGERLYRTGDLVRYLPGGDIEFIGRADRQVKVRGFRVELGDIESTLVHQESVSEVTVIGSQTNNDTRLVAYVVAKEGARPTASQLHGYLRERLPDYMIPSAFVLLDHLPLTSSGKVDVTALPPTELTRPDLDVEYEMPRDPVETVLAEIWASMLGIERVGIHDDFLEIGGDSLIAARIASRVVDRFKVEITLVTLFKQPTVAEMAAEISSLMRF